MNVYIYSEMQNKIEKNARGILSGSYADITDYGYKTVYQRNIAKTGKMLIDVYNCCLSKKHSAN